MGLILPNEEIFDFDLLSFWKFRSESYTLLSQLARVIHCIPSSSVEIERVRSKAGLIENEQLEFQGEFVLFQQFQLLKKIASAIRDQGPVN